MLSVEARRNTDPGPRKGAFEVARKVFQGQIYRVEVFRIVAGQGVQHEGVVLHGAGHGTDVVKAPGEREDATLAHAPVGRLHADDTAEGRGDADGAPCV